MKRHRCHAIVLILMILIFTTTAGTQNAKPVLPSTVYLLASFRGNGDGLHMAWCADGLKWAALAVNRDVVTALLKFQPARNSTGA
jgi:hypothetical protein